MYLAHAFTLASGVIRQGERHFKQIRLYLALEGTRVVGLAVPLTQTRPLGKPGFLLSDGACHSDGIRERRLSTKIMPHEVSIPISNNGRRVIRK